MPSKELIYYSTDIKMKVRRLFSQAGLSKGFFKKTAIPTIEVKERLKNSWVIYHR